MNSLEKATVALNYLCGMAQHIEDIYAQEAVSHLEQTLTELERLQKKEIAMKLKNDKCQSCGKQFYLNTRSWDIDLSVVTAYCPDCGQRLDWSDIDVNT